MSNDLISREALKKHILEIFETEEKIDKKWAMGLKYSLKIIDLAPTIEEKPQDDLIKAFELLKAYCKNRECNKDCVFYRELRVGDNTEQFCGLCEIVTSDDKEKNND